MRAIESGGSNDFDELLSSLITNENKSYVIRGFELEMAGSIGASASNLQMIVSGSAMLHGQSNTSGTFFQVREGTANETLSSTTNSKIVGAFTPSALNYVGLEFIRQVDDSTAIQTYLWNPTVGAEIVKTLPFLETLDFQIIISSTLFASNVIPISIVETDTANNVLSVQDRRPMLFRLGTAGVSTPDPFYDYPWTNDSEGRVENYWQSSSSLNSPFRGGDKQILSFKENDDALKTEIKLLKGTNYWYSPAIGGSISGLRYDVANTLMTGEGAITHSSSVAGQMNWDENIFLTVISSRLKYKLEAYAAGTNLTLADGQAAYINIIRNQDITPQLIFTNGSGVVTSVGSVSWTTLLEADDFIKVGSDEDTEYYQILSIDSTSQVTLKTVFTGTSTGINGIDAKYAYGNYRTNAAPSTDRHIKIAARQDVPFDANTYWLMFRDDNGGIPRVYVRFLGAELEQGESLHISDGVPLAVLQYTGSSGDGDSTPDYTNATVVPEVNHYLTDGDNLTKGIKSLDKSLYSVATAAAASLSQLRITPHETLSDSVRISGADAILASGITLTQSMKNLVLSFEGAVVDFTTGDVFKSDGVTALGVNFTPFALPAGESIWYAVTLTSSISNSENEITATISVVPASTSEAVVANAPKAKYTKGIALGQVLITDTAGVMDDIESDHILQLGVIGGSGGSGSGSGEAKVNLIDPVSTTLPAGVSAVIDDVTIADDDIVLFTNLAVNNNRAYKVSGVGVALAWAAQDIFENGIDPVGGEIVRATEGAGFEGTAGVYNDSTSSFNFNDYVRYFSGANYYEQSSLKSSTIANNTIGTLFTVASAGSENMIVDFSIVRNGIKETGTVVITTNGTDISSPKTGAGTGITGVDLYAEISGSDVLFRYNADASGSNGLVKYSVKRWSDSVGGPAGLPNYSGSGISGTLAGGAITEIQFHGAGGLLDGDANMRWDNSEKQINLNGYYIGKLSSPFTIADNQTTSATVISYAAATYRNAVIEYSIERNGENRLGTLFVVNNGTAASIRDENGDTGGVGIDDIAIPFTATISAGNVLIQYTSSNTGFTGVFKASMRRWS